ncbi:MAG: AbrB/MazE/SpoVT family DNA-binding domain-containing protein [Firmicutes bacterium]|nr:AbrB/MazE/SpoVT family DNA-binding domain-containing protein [Candidatus Fermentithermobacillaceae bacterium]
MLKVTMSAKGQIVIPAEVRRRLSLKAGTHLRVYEGDGKIVLVPEVEDPVSAGLGFFRRERVRSETGDMKEGAPGSA